MLSKIIINFVWGLYGGYNFLLSMQGLSLYVCRLFSGGLAHSCYHNAFMTAILTFGIRLYQRKNQQGVSCLKNDVT